MRVEPGPSADSLDSLITELQEKTRDTLGSAMSKVSCVLIKRKMVFVFLLHDQGWQITISLYHHIIYNNDYLSTTVLW